MASGRTVVITYSGLEALQRRPLTKTESLVLWQLVSGLPPTGRIISLAELGRSLSITNGQTATATKQLCQTGFLLRGARIGLSYHYKLNPAFFRILS